jgi:hypothetical protein
MTDLKPGARVRIVKAIYTFGRKHEGKLARFDRVTDADGHPIVITDDHFAVVCAEVEEVPDGE